MSWTRPAQLRAQVQKLWDRGELLASVVSGEPLFPRRLVLKGPTSAEMAERFDAVRAWVAELRTMPHCRVEMRDFRHRVFGANAVPHEAWVDSLDEALALIGKRHECARFTALAGLTRQRQPQLLPWLAKRPLRALELAGEWSRLLAIVAWVEETSSHSSRPDVYLRQVDIAGVHSKFIETHRGVLAEWLDLTLPPAAVDHSASGVGGFARRYGFRDKPLRIRFRILDPARSRLPGDFGDDITLDAGSFARLDPGVARVFITENEINFLAFPPVRDSLIVFGAGYGFEVLAQAQWLSGCRIHYWGDIDTHGFAILDQLRALFGHVDSFLMDRAALLAFETQWGEEDKPTRRDLPRLNPEERALYDDLRDNRLRKELRLEQERIGFGWVEAAIAKLQDANGPGGPADRHPR
ncbi:Wadjet anti-phage system protein JetD domain-containing protein [Accumulibacter sp.]|uniref:Wadjet anti-phage system protein JetD domain-containing protein n=1 Tax=Accumulibacter sp. TaxID=2053492 RepID=UPI002603EBBE|nr:Wadjet anti-phage system protein JetD domain-containing protein [Accumulibacter sp.]